MSDAADKMARTRLAIIEYVHRREQGGRKGASRQASEEHEPGDPWEAAEAAAASSHGGWFTGIKRAAQSWWRHHPARMGLDFATPTLAEFARRKPVQYLSIAAAAGAVFMVARPWRLISVTGVLVALLKSPQLASVVVSAMSSSDDEGTQPPYR
jgi:hypothetical protein